MIKELTDKRKILEACGYDTPHYRKEQVFKDFLFGDVITMPGNVADKTLMKKLTSTGYLFMWVSDMTSKHIKEILFKRDALIYQQKLFYDETGKKILVAWLKYKHARKFILELNRYRKEHQRGHTTIKHTHNFTKSLKLAKSTV
jgi:hypothetical protein